MERTEKLHFLLVFIDVENLEDSVDSAWETVYNEWN